MTDSLLRNRVAELAGLQTWYRDGSGAQHNVGDRALDAILTALGLPAESDAAATRSIESVERERSSRLLSPVIVAFEDDAQLVVPIAVPDGNSGRITWRIDTEAGEPLEGAGDAAGAVEQQCLRIGQLPPPGYHRLEVTLAGETRSTDSAVLIVAPRRCYRPPALEGDGRRWGLAVQLYAVRSARNWGIGDFTDLLAIVRGVAPLGAATVGLNPLHALFPWNPRAASPYSPNSRIFLNILYLDVEAIEDYGAAARQLVATPEFLGRLRTLREATMVDYVGVAAAKLEVLELASRAFAEHCRHDPESPRTRAFRAFCEAGGRALRRFALFETLAEVAIAEGRGFGWRNWRPEWRDPDGPAVRQLEAEHAARIAHHEYLQWQAELQLAEVRRTAERLGMSIGLYNDLAVGVDGGGAEAWDWQGVLVAEASVGAPPDAWNPKGQAWGLPPFHPHRLAAHAYAPFIELLRANMRRGGALRIDHILGFMRLYWIPSGASPTDGAYVGYPWRDLLAILALESHRNRCLVVGEDLGTLPEGLHEALYEAGILSYRLLYFEKSGPSAFRSPEDYPTEALVAATTHDLPTLAGYWSGADLAVRDRLGLWPSRELGETARRERSGDRAALLTLLHGEGLAGAAATQAPPIPDIYDLLARTPSRLLMLQIEDVAGQIDQVNVPGTDTEYPNWRRRLDPTLDAMLGGASLRALAVRLDRWRGDRPSPVALADMASADGMGPREIPGATYRLQLSLDFAFDDAARIVPYLAALGVSHLYLSPPFKARPGSRHGYDIIAHDIVSPELGGDAGLDHLSAVLADHRIGLILDFVPNHMGIGGADNAWWLDVLEWGKASPYAGFFDIDWEPVDRRLRGKVLLPFLADHYGRELEAGHLVPRFEARTGTFSVWYFDHRFPIAVRNYSPLLRTALAEAEQLAPIAAGIAKLGEGNRTEAQALQARLAALALAEVPVAEALARAAASLQGAQGDPQSFEPLHRLLEQQHYRLAYWRVASDEINYRRFFNINDLAGIRIENAELFAACHRQIARLIREGKLHGLRIDHVDGLFDPRSYCARLQEIAAEARGMRAQGDAPPFYVVVEKILARHERLRADWPVAGTTGYDFAVQVGGLLVAARNEPAASQNYARFIRREPDFDELLQASKELVMDTMLSSELGVLANELHRIAQRSWNSRDYTRAGLRRALRMVIACFPVYRSYVTAGVVSADDRRDIEWAVARARRDWRGLGSDIFDFLEGILTADPTRAGAAGRVPDAVAAFAMKFQQYTAPVMAKGMEDTAFYRYHRLVALNEVGGDPRQFGISIAAFHHANQERARFWPNAMLATATHDTKRGEDARARLAALSEVPGEWARESARWARLNLVHKQEFDGRPAPGRNDEYLLYQALIGAWPAGTSEEPSGDGEFVARIQAYMLKAAREAKERTSWDNPDAAYEAALERFIARLFHLKHGRAFRRRFLAFQARVAIFGMLNSLVQVTLKLTSPGVPDLFQGTELWDLSLVDPDNRRQVDFGERARLLGEVAAIAALSGAQRAAAVESLRESWTDGRIKLYLLHCLLRLRRDMAHLFRGGDYRPLTVAGAEAERVCAFLRRDGARRVVVAVGRHFAAQTAPGATHPSAAGWQDTTVQLPGEEALTLRDLFTDRIYAGSPMIAVRDLFAHLPVAVLIDDVPDAR
jgi:(1->4)-alpha-D-glucan 1-alpha-D-glucosylmutase